MAKIPISADVLVVPLKFIATLSLFSFTYPVLSIEILGGIIFFSGIINLRLDLLFNSEIIASASGILKLCPCLNI